MVICGFQPWKQARVESSLLLWLSCNIEFWLALLDNIVITYNKTSVNASSVDFMYEYRRPELGYHYVCW